MGLWPRPLLPEELASADIQTFIDDLVESMRAANGAGLAANQVHNPIQICALEVKDNTRYPYKPTIPRTNLINPRGQTRQVDLYLPNAPANAPKQSDEQVKVSHQLCTKRYETFLKSLK